jgi:O-antigen ligase
LTATTSYWRFVRLLTFLLMTSPLIIWWDHPYPVTAGPVYHVRVFVLALAVLTLFNQPSALTRWTGSPVAWAVVAWCGALLVTTAFGQDPMLSLWSTPDRLTGVVDQLVWVAAALLLSQLVTDWRWTVAVGTATGGVLAIAAIVEALVFGESRAVGLTRNPGFTAIYASCTAIAAVVLGASSRRWAVWAAISLAAVVAVEMTETRAAVLGTVVGLGLLVLMGSRRTRVWAGLALLVLGILVVRGPVLDRLASAVESAPAAVATVGGVERGDTIGDGSVSERAEAWRVAIQAFRSQPLVGYGPNAYGLAHRELAAEGYIYSDYAHNMLIEEFATKGIFGVLSLVLGAAVGWRLWQGRRDPMGLLSLAVLGALAVYAAFWFPTWLMGLWCVLVLGYALRQRDDHGAERVKPEP